jgi:tetratricopeptide (TPR) repeat protein
MKLGLGGDQHLDPLPGPIAERLVRDELTRRGLEHDDAAVQDLAARSGGLPLAASLLVGQAHAGPPHARLDQRPAEDQDVVSNLLDHTLQTLTGPSERSALFITALMPNGIPATVLESALSAYGEPDEQAGKPISALVNLNLIDYDRVSSTYTTLPVFKRYLARGQWLPGASWNGDAKAGRLALVRAFGPHLTERSEALWAHAPTHAEWELERPNAFAVIRIALEERDFDGAGRLLEDFYTFAITFGHFGEYLHWTDAVLTSGQTIDALLEGALRVRRASILSHARRDDQAAAELEMALRVLARLTLPPALQNFVFFVRAIVAVATKDPTAETILREAIAFEEGRDVSWARLGFQGWLVLLLVSLGRLEEAEELCERSLSEARANADQRTEVFLLVGKTRLNSARADWTATLQAREAILDLAEQYGEDHNRAHLYVEIGRAFLSTGDRELGRALLEQAEQLYARIGVGPEAERCRELVDAAS